MFAEPIANVTVAVGRDAALACVVENLGNHRVSCTKPRVARRRDGGGLTFCGGKGWPLKSGNALFPVITRAITNRVLSICAGQVNSDPMVSQVGHVHVVGKLEISSSSCLT